MDIKALYYSIPGYASVLELADIGLLWMETKNCLFIKSAGIGSLKFWKLISESITDKPKNNEIYHVERDKII